MSDRISIQTAVNENRLDEYLFDLEDSKADTLSNYIAKGKTVLDKDVKDKMYEWIESLTSGKFEQGDTKLVSMDKKYCCLGVAGEICKIDTALMEGVPYPEEVGDNENCPLWKYLKLNHEESMALAVANDGGFSFGEIAELIKWKYNL